MRYKVGDKVRIKSIEWYNENKDKDGYVDCDSFFFDEDLSNLCNNVVTIVIVCKDCYMIKEDATVYVTDEMIEGLVEEEKPLYKALVDKDGYMTGEFVRLKETKQEITCPEGYIFKDENGNVINATKIVLEKKKPKYPESYEECCDILNTCQNIPTVPGWKGSKIAKFQELLICRDAYWKIAGDWKPKYESLVIDEYFTIHTFNSEIVKSRTSHRNAVLAFPTKEMRDAFYENFKELIEKCKELL